MTVDEMKVVITADNSDVKKKINDLNNSINEFQNKINSFLGFDSSNFEKPIYQIQKMQQNLALQQQQDAEKQSLLLQQLNEKEFLRRKFYDSMLMSQEDFLRERHAMLVEHLDQRNALRKEQLNERTAAKELQLIERNANRQKELDEKRSKGKNSLLSKSLGSFSLGNMLGIGTAATIGVMIGKTIKKGITDAMGAIESESLFQVSFNKIADDMRKWSKEVSDSLGLNVADLRRTTATVYEMVKSMGIGEQASINMAKGVSLLSQDMASFLQRNPEEIYHKITAGLMGQTRGLHLLGKAITETTVKQYAWAHGIAESGKQLTEQQKVVSRYLLLMEQTKVMHGNLAQTMMSPANQMKIFNANMKTFSQTLGNLFIPLLNKVMPILNAFVKIITMAIEAVGKFFGVPTNEQYAKKLHEGLNGSIDASKGLNEQAEDYNKNLKDADKNIKKIQKSLAKFDEMNVLMDKTKTPKSKSTGMEGYGQTFDFPIPEYDWHKEWVNNQIDKIVDSWKQAFSGIDFTSFQNSLRNLGSAIKPIIEDIGKVFKWLFDKFLIPLATWTFQDALPAFFDLLSGALRILQPLLETVGGTFKWWWDTILDPIAKWTGGVFVWTLKQISKWLKLIGENKEAMEFLKDIVQIVTGLGIALLTVSTAIKAVQLAMAGFQLILGLVTNPIGLVVLAILAIATAIALVIKYFPQIKEGFINTFNAIKEAVGKVATWFKNTIKRFFEDPIGAVVDSFKWLINTLSGNKLQVPQQTTNKNQYAMPNIPIRKMAIGGIVNKPTFAQIGESGAEAVVPLEKNTGWIDMLVSKLNGNSNGQPINLIVKIGEDNIINRVIDGINNKSVEMGRGVVMV